MVTRLISNNINLYKNYISSGVLVVVVDGGGEGIITTAIVVSCGCTII